VTLLKYKTFPLQWECLFAAAAFFLFHFSPSSFFIVYGCYNQQL
jgi:hypothetical protein